MCSPYRKVIGLLVAVLLFAAAPTVRAAITLEGITPARPLAGQTVTARLSDGECDSLLYASGYPRITRNGNNIRMVVESYHANSLPFCLFTPSTIGISVGSFSAGSYSLQVDRHYIAFLGNSVIETVGTAPFTVAAAAAEPIPTVGTVGLLAMISSIVLGACLALRRRKIVGAVV